MAEEYGYVESFKATREAQQKFDYFYLGIVLATLALSIQTYSSTPTYCYRSLLIQSWGLWLASFIAGFFRIERTVSFFSVETSYLQYKQKYDVFSKAQAGQMQLMKEPNSPWTEKELKEELTKMDDLLQFSDRLKKRRVKQARIAYQISKWMYFLGIISYVVFRAVNLYAMPIIQEGTN